MAFKILFRGLVCHLTKEKTAVFVKAHQHQLRLVVRTSDIVGTPTFPSDSVHTQIDDEDDGVVGERISLQVAGGTLRIQGVMDKTLICGSDFVERVPSLRDGSDCTDLRPEIRQRKIDPSIFGYLEYPGGTLTVKKYFPEQAIFAGDTPQCIARTVQLSLSTNGKPVTIRNGSRKVELKPDAEVKFVNVDLTALGLPNQHFHHYYEAIYSGCGMGKSPAPPSQFVRCEFEQKPGPVFPGTDCSNSHEP